MSKRCDVCNAEYADDLKACPHCKTESLTPAEAVNEDNLWDLVEDESQSPPAPSDSSVDAYATLPVDEIPPSEFPSHGSKEHDRDQMGDADLGGSVPQQHAPTTGLPAPAPKTMLGRGRANETEMAFPSEMFAEVHSDDAPSFNQPEPPRPPAPAGAAENKLATPPSAPSEDDVILDDSEAHKDVGASQVDLGSSGSFHGLTGVSITNVSQGSIPTRAAPAEPPAEPPPVLDEEAALEAEEHESPAEKAPKPRAGRPMLVGGAVGAAAGGVVAVALAMFNVLPVNSLQEMVGTAPEKPKSPVTSAAPQNPAPIQPAATSPSAELMLVSGEFQKAFDEYQKAENPDAAGLTKRGLARWLMYLQQQVQANKPPSAADEAVVQARKDLTEAKSPEAKFWLDRIDTSLALGQMEASLAKAGFLAAGKQTDPVKALETALTTKKGGATPGPALASLVERLKKDKAVAAADPEVKDVAKALDVLLQSKADAESKRSAAESKLTAAETKATEAEAAQKKADKTVADATRQMKAAEEQKKTAEEQVAELAKKTAAAEGTLQELVKRLTAAKHLEPAADTSDVLRGVDRLIAAAAAKGGNAGGTNAAKPERTTRPATPIADVSPRPKPSVDQSRRESPVATATRWADPEGSERHYSAGVRFYWLRRYTDAEREFNRAIQYNDGDARYVYYLGLTQLALGQRDKALESFGRAGQLEQEQRPPREMVSESLERIQGQERGLLNRYRP